MPILLDTSILVRLANRADAQYVVADAAVAELFLRNERVCITAQNLVEFRNVATRPFAANGLGMSVADSQAKATEFEALFSLRPETPDIIPAWKAIVDAGQVIGKQVHDARLVAVCQVHGVTHLLTFNLTHFTTLAAFVSGLVIADPANI
jgi:predicted nucleic acid-binding protein